jgi:Zn-finger nucleic acid-binding protein
MAAHTRQANPTGHAMTLHELLCPRSSAPLVHLMIGGVEVDVCEECGGLWLDRLELSRFDQADDAFGDALMAHLSQFPVEIVDRSIRLRCPRHPAIVMMRRAFSRSVPTEIDECPQCGGLWLDADELARIRR